MTKKQPAKDGKSRVRRQRDPIPWKYCVLTVLCGLLLVGGFFAAARQHFSAVGYGMKNADLRLQISKLKDENRRLELSKQRASSPVRIAKAATNLGFAPNPGPIVATNIDAKSLKNEPVVPMTKNEPGKAGLKNSDEKIPVTPVKAHDLSDNQIAALRNDKN